MAKLHHDPRSGRYILEARELHAGDVIEIALESGQHVRVRFLWRHLPDQEPKGYFVVALAGGKEVRLDLPLGAEARWPSEEPPPNG